jgi:hypothetical protein
MTERARALVGAADARCPVWLQYVICALWLSAALVVAALSLGHRNTELVGDALIGAAAGLLAAFITRRLGRSG